MTSQLLILGNGFDVHCGLKSSYNDFFRNAVFDPVGESVGRKELRAGVRGFWEILLLEYYEVYDRNNYNWCDIESIIKETLLSIYFGDKSSEENIDRGLYMKALNYHTGIAQSFDRTKLKNIQKFLFDYCLDFISLNNLNVLSPIKGLGVLCENLLQQLNNFEQRFCRYLKSQINNSDNENELNEKYIVNAVNLLAKLTGFSTSTFSDINNIIHQEYGEIEEKTGPNSSTVRYTNFNVLAKKFDKLKSIHILSFNYTALFDILSVKSPCEYNNVHGKLCRKKCVENCAESNIIFGIDDILIQGQSAASPLRIYSKTYRKMLALERSSSALPLKDVAPIEIKFYGHSLSEADYSYFQSIFDYYDLYGNSDVSLIFYYSKGYEQYDAIYKLISEYGKSLTNKEQGKNLIHKLLLENRLQIQELDE